MFQDGPRRQGRFIKKNAKILKYVAMSDFSFKNVNEAKALPLDNPARNIVHSQYHDPDDIEASVRRPEKFFDDLLPPDANRQIILPVDFTHDWERSRKMRKDKAKHIDDEEYDFEYEMAQRAMAQELARQEADRINAQASSGSKKGTNRTGVQAPVEVPITSEVGSRSVESATNGVADALQSSSERQNVDAAGHAIKILKQGGATTQLEPTSATAPTSPSQAAAPISAAKVKDENTQFIPMVGGNNPPPHAMPPGDPGMPPTATAEPMTPEVDAQRLYRLRQELEAANQQLLAELTQEAKAHGYREGFRAGEEKGELQARQHAMALFGKVNEILREFGHLKHSILENTQENFYEICQALGEALLKREFSIRPESFATVVRRAISETVEPGKCHVRIHPETWSKLASLGDPSLLEFMVKDQAIPPGDFKIESELSVVDVNIHKMIADLLQQADLSLYEAEQNLQPEPKAS